MPYPFRRSRRFGTGEDIVPPPPPPPTGFRTFIGSWNLPDNLWGDQPTPDVVQSDGSGVNWVEPNGHIDRLTAVGGAIYGKFYGANTNVMTNPPDDRSFSRQKWTDRFDSWRNGVISVTGGTSKLRTAIRNGIFRALVGFDDFIAAHEDGGASGNAFFPEVTYEDIEFCCEHVKVVRGWSWLPIAGRGPCQGLLEKAIDGHPGRKYKFLDAGWLQMRPRLDGDIPTYLTNQIGAGEDCDLGAMSGINIRMGAGTTPGWGCVPVGNRCYVSPAEIRAVGLNCMLRPQLSGWAIWAANAVNFDYWSLPDIQIALQDVYNASLGRVDGPLNIRGDLTPA